MTSTMPKPVLLRAIAPRRRTSAEGEETAPGDAPAVGTGRQVAVRVPTVAVDKAAVMIVVVIVAMVMIVRVIMVVCVIVVVVVLGRGGPEDAPQALIDQGQGDDDD